MSEDINVRPMKEQEKSIVHSLGRRSFPLFIGIFFSLSPHTFVAEKDGELLGGIVLTFYPVKNGKQGGFVSWVFTSPAARGLGVAGKLLDTAMDYFNEKGCQEFGACIEGHNTSSSKLFAARGFDILSPGEQFRRYEKLLPSVWYKTFHFVDIGHFLWVKPPAARSDRPLLQWLAVWFLNSLFLLLALWRANGFTPINPLAFAAIPIAVLVFFSSRWAAMTLTAKAIGLETRFRAWETGLVVTFLIALLLGGQFPTPGSSYPKTNQWTYRDVIPKMGRMALAGIGSVLVLAWIPYLLSAFVELPHATAAWLSYFRFVGTPFALYEVVLAVIFPFVSFNGRRIWDWNRPLWVVLALLTVGLFVLF
jgi:GNAT superfamily N-acetyltransferase